MSQGIQDIGIPFCKWKKSPQTSANHEYVTNSKWV